MHSNFPKYPRRSYKSYCNSDGKIDLDFRKDNHALLHEILSAVAGGTVHAASSGKKGKLLGYLIAYVKYCNYNAEHAQRTPPTYSVIEQLLCFRTALVHESWEIRAAALRCIRYLMRTRQDAECCVACQVPIFVARSVDLMLQNHSERIHALRLMRRMMFLAPDIFPDNLARALVALIQDGPAMNDRTGPDWMFKAALAVACELGICNPVLLVECGGISALSHSLIFCPSAAPAMGEAVLGVLLHILNGSETRTLLSLSPDDLTLAVEERWSLKETLTRTVETSMSRRDPLSLLHAIMAPLTDVHYRFLEGTNDASSVSDDRDSHGQACSQILLSALRSWAGMVCFFTNPDVEYMKGSSYSSQPPLKSIVSVLSAKESNTKNAIIMCLFELFQIQIPEWTDDFLQALRSSDPGAVQDSWKLYEGFVAAEGNALIPLPGSTRPRLAKNHAALLLSTFISIGILEGLVKVVLESRAHLSVRAVILLGELLHLSEVLLPAAVCTTERQSCLKQLVAVGTDESATAEERERASRSLSALARIHSLKKRSPRPNSAFLEQLMIFANYSGLKVVGSKHLDGIAFVVPVAREPIVVDVQPQTPGLKREKEEGFASTVDETSVLKTEDSNDWNWNAVSVMFLNPLVKFRRYWDDVSCKSLINRLMTFFKPSSMQYCGLEVSHHLARITTSVCCLLLNFLTDSDDPEAARLLEEFLMDVRCELGGLVGEKLNRTSALSPSRVHNSMAQSYFLFLGRLTGSKRGMKTMGKLGLTQLLLGMAAQNTHDSHVKLIISSLDYSKEGICRAILSKVLTDGADTAKLYATQFLEVLARLETPDFQEWGTRMLVNQLYDPAASISMAASRILDKLCDNDAYLDAVIDLKPTLLHFGDRGLLLYIRFLSVPKGFRCLRDNGFLESELSKWRESWNLRYVKVVESVLHDSFSYYQRGEDGSYGRRTNDHHQVGASRLVPHIYGELARHEEGFDYLFQKEISVITRFFELITAAGRLLWRTDRDRVLGRADWTYGDAEELLELKAAVWAVGHICYSERGVRYVIEERYEVIRSLVLMAESAPEFSLRGTCFYVLGLVGASPPGVALLSRFGWESVRIRSSESWPTRYWEEISNDPMVEYSFEAVSPVEELVTNGGIAADGDANDLSMNTTKYRSVSMDDSFAAKSRADTGVVVGDEADADDAVGAVRLRAGGDFLDGAESVPIVIPNAKGDRSSARAYSATNGHEYANSLDHSGLSSDSGIVHELIDALVNSAKSPELRRGVVGPAPVVYLTPPTRVDDDRYGLTEDSETFEVARRPRVHRDTTGTTSSSDLPTPDFRVGSFVRQRSETSDLVEGEIGVTADVEKSRNNRSTSELSNFARRRKRFVPTPKSSGSSEQNSLFRSLRYYRRPEAVTLPYELPLHDSQFSPPSGSFVKGHSFLRDLFDHSVSSEKRNSTVISPGNSPLSQSVPGKRHGKGFAYFSLRRGRKSESDVPPLPLKKQLPGKESKVVAGDVPSPVSGHHSLPAWFAQKSGLFRKSRRPRSVGNVSLASAAAGTPPSSDSQLTRLTARSGFANIPEVPPPVAVVITQKEQDVADGGAVAAAGGERTGIQYVGVALPVDFTALLSAGNARTVDHHGANAHHGTMPRDLDKLFPVGEDVPSDEFIGCQFLDTGDQRIRNKGTGRSFHLSGSSGISKWNEGENDFTANPSHAMTERDVGDGTACGHDEAHCVACHKVAALASKYPELPVHESAFRAGCTNREGDPSKEGVVRREILRLVNNMCSSVGLKTAERELLLLKQKYPLVMRDPCLYSEVAKLLGQCTFRLQSRRFLQELFLDADFSSLFDLPRRILEAGG